MQIISINACGHFRHDAARDFFSYACCDLHFKSLSLDGGKGVLCSRLLAFNFTNNVTLRLYMLDGSQDGRTGKEMKLCVGSGALLEVVFILFSKGEYPQQLTFSGNYPEEPRSSVAVESFMEAILREIASGNEEGVKSTLKVFTDTNSTIFQLDEKPSVIQDFIVLALSELKKGGWSSHTVALALHAFRIISRQKSVSSKLTEESSMVVVLGLAGLAVQEAEIEALMKDMDEEKLNVLVEAVKCLCNLVLNNHHLAKTLANLRALHALKGRLALCSAPSTRKLLRHDVLFFDLRLIFLVTACGPEERVKFRDEVGSLPVLVRALDAVLFPPTSSEVNSSADVSATPPLVNTTAAPPIQPATLSESANQTNSSGEKVVVADEASASASESEVKSKCEQTSEKTFSAREYVLPEPLSENQCALVNELLKVIFNQTVTWKNGENMAEEEEKLFDTLSRLLRVLVISVPPLKSKSYSDVFNHTCEVMMNVPFSCSSRFLIPKSHAITPAFVSLHPTYFKDHAPNLSTLDEVSGEWNLCVGVVLLNTLDLRSLAESQNVDKTGLTAVLGACSLLCRSCPVIRKFFRFKILPAVKEVKACPNEENSLKGRLVRLMTAGLHDCMDVVAEFLFILCKENANRLIKHTGYGNAAGILMNRGLLYGGQSGNQGDYSSDSEGSDEEYSTHVDPVTGGPMKEKQDPFENMSAEEIETEAEKLGLLIDKLNKKGFIKMMPMDKDSNPVQLPQAPPEKQKDDKSSSDES